MLVGLDWAALDARFAGMPADTRARVLDLMTSIEGAALAADSERRASQPGED